MNRYNFKNKEELVCFLKENVLTRKEAEKYLDIRKQSFSRAISKGKISAFKEVGEGTGKVALYLKEDLDYYRIQLQTDLKKYNPKKR